MPPRTRSNKMAGTSAEGEETNLNPPTSEGDLASLMAQMLADLRRDLQQDIQASEGHTRAVQNTLFEEFNALRGERKSRTPTPRGNVAPNEVPEEFFEEWHGEVEGGNVRNQDENRGFGRFGMGNQRGRVGLYGDDRGGYESRYHEDGLDRGSSGERAPKSHEEWHSRRVRNHVSFKGFERPIEEEVSYRARLRPTNRHHGVDTNQMGTPSSRLTTSSSFHFSHEPLDVYGKVPSSMSLSQISREKERERERKDLRVKVSLKSQESVIKDKSVRCKSQERVVGVREKKNTT